MKHYKDKNDIDIRDGDLVKVYHFTGIRRKKYYMYKIIRNIEDKWMGIHITPNQPLDYIPNNCKEIITKRIGYFLPFTELADKSYQQTPKKLDDYEILTIY